MEYLILFLILMGLFLVADADATYNNPFKKQGLSGNIMILIGLLLLITLCSCEPSRAKYYDSYTKNLPKDTTHTHNQFMYLY
jgi:hypothetical protein